MVKPVGKAMREFLHIDIKLNNTLEKLSLLFNELQKILDNKFLHTVHQNVKKLYRDIIKFHSFKLSNRVVKDYIKMCERVNQDVSDCYSSDR